MLPNRYNRREKSDMAEYLSIKEYYERLRARNQQLRRDRIADAYQRCDGLREIELSLKTLELRRAEALLMKEDFDADAFETQRNTLRERRTQLLLQAGISPDYMDDIYTCPICKDEGSINGEHCQCFKQLKADMLFQASPIKRQLAYENFDTFDFSYYSDQPSKTHNLSPRANIQTVYDSAKTFVKHFPQGLNLLFQGTTGVGKTFLTNCIAAELLKQGYMVTYVSATQFFDTLADHSFHRENTAEDKERYQYLFDCDLLIIDDLGTEVNNQFVDSALFEYLNAHMKQTNSTIISTNLTMKQIEEKYSKRVLSRITQQFHRLPVFGDDIRLSRERRAQTDGKPF
jgi:DNA replication protein DnaC